MCTLCTLCGAGKSDSGMRTENHSESWGPAMKTLLILLLALACAMPMPQGKDSSEEESQESQESNETTEDLQELEGNEDFVITSSCFVEATDGDGNLDEQTLEKCVQCFEEADDLGEGDDAVEAAKACTVEHLPNFYEDCKEGIESPSVPAAEVLECFMDFVEVFDQTGELRQGVKELLGL